MQDLNYTSFVPSSMANARYHFLSLPFSLFEGLVWSFCRNAFEMNAKWPKSADQYVLVQEIGSGATSLVYRAHCPAGECAVKVFRLKELPETAEGMFWR
jgi:hypothetical protein